MKHLQSSARTPGSNTPTGTGRRFGPLLGLLLAMFVACGGETSDDEPDSSDAVTDIADGPNEDAAGDVTSTDAGDRDTDAAADAPDVEADAPDSDPDAETDAGAEVDGEDDTGSPPLPALDTRAPLSPPVDSLAGTDIESCAVYREERCVEGQVQRCRIYDPGESGFVADPDPLLHRAFLFDRIRDLYNSPDGQAIDRDFVSEVLPGTPEEEWASLDRFRCYCGTGDGGIWTGWATVAAILRYSQTGTEADYERMEQYVRDLVTMYDVTGIPGYLSRYHYLLLPEGGPKNDEHILQWEDTHSDSHHRRDVVDPETIENLPAAYTEGIVDDEGEVWVGRPMWQGRPSIDQNTGPMTALPMAHSLLRDEALQASIERHLTCYLKRLQRIELINLQSNTELLDTLLAYFSAGELLLEPEDIDLTALDQIVGYVHRQINTLNEDTYDRSCPETVQLEPWRVIDAASPTFLLDLIEFIGDMSTSDERVGSLDHYYFPSIRGGDAMHLMHLATMAYHFTGDDQYRRFLFEELIGDIQTVRVADTAGAFQLPRYCRAYYGDQITYGPWWAFLQLLDEGELLTSMQQAFHAEIWSKHLHETANVDLAIMYVGALPPEIATDREAALALVDELLPLMGGNGGAMMGDPFDPRWLDDPKRTYTLTAEQVFAFADESVEAVCPLPGEVAACNAEIEYAGIALPGLASGSHACSEGEHECPIDEEGQCMTWRTNEALPPPLRPATDFLWQRNAFEIGAGAHFEGWRQFGGADYSEPYWNARRYGFVTEGAGQVLAWETVGACDD